MAEKVETRKIDGQDVQFDFYKNQEGDHQVAVSINGQKWFAFVESGGVCFLYLVKDHKLDEDDDFSWTPTLKVLYDNFPLMRQNANNLEEFLDRNKFFKNEFKKTFQETMPNIDNFLICFEVPYKPENCTSVGNYFVLRPTDGSRFWTFYPKRP
eukprot:GHVP01036728.1.p1 GENE.GHVP01036728.1~~GHVP01036728.1.p1  ORF type:complete len:154 (-),score=25.36 GHVP01036728.1:129-590(-)